MAHLCEQHNLVLANDGRCVLCRRAQRRFLDLEPKPPSNGDRVLTGALGVGLLAALGMLLWALQLPQLDSAPRYGDASTTRLPTDGATAIEGVPNGAGSTGNTLVESALGEDSLAPSIEPERSDKAVARETPKPRSQQQEQALRAAQQAVEDEKRAVPITMYSTAWCTICETSRYYLLGRELTYAEHDIERDQAAAKRMAKVNPARSVPTFVIDGEVLVGFNAWQLEGALEKAAKKRVAAKPGSTCKAEAPCTQPAGSAKQASPSGN